MDTRVGDAAALLDAWGQGDRSIEPRLFSLVEPDLKRLARGWIRSEHVGEPAALLNEAYCLLIAVPDRTAENRRHFFAFAARRMGRLLVEYARNPAAVESDAWLRASGDKINQAVEIGGLLDRVEDLHQDWNPIVALKFYLGFTDEETADALAMPLRTVQRKFSDARRWLFEKLEPGLCQDLPTPDTKLTNS